MEKVWSIQYLRAIAALGVVIFHSLESSEHRFIVGQAGVDLFFIISGFIMASLMSGPEGKPGIFLGRRLLRIVPLYWIATFAALFVTWIKPNFFRSMDPSVSNTILSLFFVPHESATGIAPVLTPLAATGLAVTMILAAIVHGRRGEPQMIIVNAVLLALALFVAIMRFGPQAF